MKTDHALQIRDLYVRELAAEAGRADRAGAAGAPEPAGGHRRVDNGGGETLGQSTSGSAGGANGGPGLEVEASVEVDLAPAEAGIVPLDAYWASFGDASTRAVLRTAAADAMEVVVGPDDRVQVGDTAVYPWRAIASLSITAANGTSWIGTGWFIGPRLLMTAGHCVHMADQGGWARQIEVMPGRNGGTLPYGSVVSTQFGSVEGWTRDRNRDFDYGVIMLGPDQRLGDTVGTFGWESRSDAGLLGATINLSGYPGDKPAGTQWFHSNTIKAVTPNTFSYDVDTAGGQSGAPVWMLFGDQRRAVGIHTNGAITGNSATRINNNVANNIVFWRNQVP